MIATTSPSERPERLKKGKPARSAGSRQRRSLQMDACRPVVVPVDPARPRGSVEDRGHDVSALTSPFR
jgi:hypothetical protein